MGRHVSTGRRRSLRGRLFVVLLAIVVLLGAAAFAAYAIWHRTHDHSPARHTRIPATPAGPATGARSSPP